MKIFDSTVFALCIFLLISLLSVSTQGRHIGNKNDEFNVAQSVDITGLWQDEDGTKYHITLIANRAYVLVDRLPEYLRSIYGTMEGNIVRGSWADLPGSRLSGSGFISFRIEDSNRLSVIAASGDTFYGSNLSKQVGDLSTGGLLGSSSGIGVGAGATEGTQSSEGIVGKWTWGNGANVTVNANGSVDAGRVKGTWSRAGNTYTFSWNNGFTDTMTLSSNGLSMRGKNNNGFDVTARRQNDSSADGGIEGSVGTTTTGAGQSAGPLEGSESLVGIWTWGNGVKVMIKADGRLDGGNVQGRWRLVDRSKKIYTFEWDNGFKDTMTLWDNNNKLKGVNNRKSTVSARRAGFEDEGVYSGGEEIAGTWEWHNGATVVITADGRIDAGGVKGKWSLIEPSSRKYRLKWYNGFTDLMSLVNGGKKLDGKNTGGSDVWGLRLLSGDIRKPWETREGQVCFEEYIREVERRINGYDGGPEHNGRKPWYVNQWGVLNSRSGYGASSDRAPDDYGKYDNRYHYMWYFWHQTGTNWGRPYLDESGVPDIWEYVDECLRRIAGN